MGLDQATGTTEDDDAGFDAGFGGTASLPTETPGQLQEAPQAQDKPAQQEPEYAQLTKAELQELKDRNAAIEAIKAEQHKSFGTAFGKIGGIERELQALKSGAAVEISEDEIKSLRDDGWDVLANALEKVRSLRSIPGGGMDESKVGELLQPKLQEQAQRFEMRILALQHPDWQTVDKDPAFAQWVAAQPAEFQQNLAQASQRYDSEVVGNAMSTFKAQRTKAAPVQADPAATRKSRMSAAVTPRGTGAISPADTDDDQFDAGFHGR